MPHHDPKSLGPLDVKVHPRLRMIRNGNTTVNALRAEHAACLRMRGPAGVEMLPCMLGDDAIPATFGGELPKTLRKSALRRVPSEL